MQLLPASAFDPANPKPGFYRHVPAVTYFSANAVNHSSLKLMDKSPAHFNAGGPQKDSDAKRLGSLAHMLLFEPDAVDGSIVPAPINPRTMEPYGSDTKAWAEYAAGQPGKLIVSPDEMDEAKRMVYSIESHPELSAVFNSRTASELVAIWDDGGVICKARIDALVDDVFIGDLKTSDDASERSFLRSVVDYSYDTQAAFYLRGCRALGLSGLDFVFGVVESDKPNLSAGYSLEAEFLEIAASRVDRWLNLVRSCRASGVWFGYTERIVSLRPPMHYVSRHVAATF